MAALVQHSHVDTNAQCLHLLCCGVPYSGAFRHDVAIYSAGIFSLFAIVCISVLTICLHFINEIAVSDFE